MTDRNVPPESGMGGLPDEEAGGPYGPTDLTDEEMTEAIRRALVLDPVLESEDFDVWVDKAIVYFTPHTDDPQKVRRGRQLFESVRGVREVVG